MFYRFANQNLGAYHVHQPVRAVGSASIPSPSYAEYRPYPYILGPVYTRPVFNEHSKSTFRFQPIIRMPSLGSDDRVVECGQKCGTDECFDACMAEVQLPTSEKVPSTPEETLESIEERTNTGAICDQVKHLPDVFLQCMRFNAEMQKASPDQKSILLQKLNETIKSCDSIKNSDDRARCYYGKLSGKWYENSLYLGAAIIGGFTAMGLAVMYARRDR